MGALIFVCPATGEEVPTGIEMDLAFSGSWTGRKSTAPIAGSRTKWLGYPIGWSLPRLSL